MKKIFILYLFLYAFASLNAQTIVSGGIYSNTSWTLSNSPYIVTDTVVVFPGVTLTIQPGVVVKFENNKRLELRQATLNAQGTATDSITFTSNSLLPAIGIWKGIYFNQSHFSKFNYCNFYYADKGVYPYYLWDTLIIKNSNFNYNNVGLGYVYYTDVIVDSCSFKHNNNGVLGYTGYITMTNSVICNNQNGIMDVANSTYNNCKIDSNINIGIEVAPGDTVMYCEIKYNGIGLGNLSSGTTTPSYITKNVIESNNIGIQLSGWFDQIFCNKICNNTAYDLKSTTNMNINNLGNNFWCTTDSMVIASHIYDGYDNINLGIVNFLPIDTSQCYLNGCNLHVFATITDATCDTCHNGSATAHVTYGLAPYTYTWNTSPPQTTQTVTGLAPGTYTLCVSDANGCTACNQNILVQSNDTLNCQLTVSSFVNHISVINGSDGSIDLTVNGGTPPYSYQWNTGATTQDINNLTAGVYTVAISSTPACPSYTYTFVILQPYDSANIIVDTLNSPIIDTCLNFIVDSFYVASITVTGSTVTAQWVFTGGGAIATIYVTYTFSNFGTQVVVLTINCNGAKDLTTYYSYIYISQIYNVTENNESEQVNIYPNPVTDFLNINFSTQTKSPVSIEIFTSTGQQVFSKSICAPTIQVGINVNNLPSGLYFVRIDFGDGKLIAKKIIK